MAKEPKANVELKDFPGLITRIDPHDLAHGAARVQINATCIQPAALTVRPGYREIKYEAE